MKNVLPPILATLILTVGLAASQDAHAGPEPIGRFVYGIECDESLDGYMFDDGESVFYCDGRQWYIVGRI